MIRVTVWGENYHEQHHELCQKIYPNGMHNTIADGLRSDELVVRTATQDQPEHGLTEQVLAETDVLIWWGHAIHHLVDDNVVERIYRRVLAGMGLIALHSAHMSKIFVKLMGTSCALIWREADEKERLWVVKPSHPIVDGLERYFELEHEEMYGEHFDIPTPDDLVLIGWFQGGEVFRSGCTFHRGKGKIFYFQPGHESYPTYHDKNIQRVISNAAKWAAPTKAPEMTYMVNAAPLEPLGR
jgi:trehalose utilization protein